MLKQPALGFGVLLFVIVLHLSIKMQGNRHKDHRFWWVSLAGIGLLISLVVLAKYWGPAYPLFLAPVLINSSLFILFGRSLLPGQTPLITQMSNSEYGETRPELAVFTRRLTIIWCGFFVIMLLESILLAKYATLEVWSLFTNILNYLFILVLFIGGYLYQIVRFNQYEHTSPLQLILRIARRGITTKIQ